MSDAVRLFLKRVVADQAFPLELKVPNAATRTAMAEADEIAAKGKARFGSADNVMADLEKAAGK
jgi:DNA-damage-inducible protein J